MAEVTVDTIELLSPTAFYDAIDFSIGELEHHGNGVGRQIIIVISDGQDNSSETSEKNAVATVMRSDAVIFALSTKGEFAVNPAAQDPDSQGYAVLRKFARVTGGQVVPAENGKRLATGFAQIQRELRSQYFVAYRPAGFVADGSYRKIKLSGNGKRLRFYAREGYYSKVSAP